MFFLTDEHRMMQKMVREFAEKEIAPKAAEIDRTCEFPADTFRKLGQQGLLGIPYPEEEGGAGFDYLSYAIAIEEVARVCGSTALSMAAHTTLGCGPLHHFGTPEQKEKFLGRLTSGEILGAYGLTEPNSGSDSGGMQTRAVKDGDHWVLNGQKAWMTNGGVAGMYTVTALTEPEKKTQGITAFLIEAGQKGAEVGAEYDKLGCRGSNTVEFFLTDCRVHKSMVLGEVNRGFHQFMEILNMGRISIGAMALGLAQAALDSAAKYSLEREQFGQPIGHFQAIQFMLADMATEIEAARLLVYQAGRLKDLGQPFAIQASKGKLFASEVAHRACHKAIQIHGGYGYSKEFPVERYMRDAKLTEIGEGTSEVQRMIIGRDLLKTTAKGMQ
ncbi:MAG: acyl-CoA dehydrogenase [Gemmatimonadota bacterium]|nr:MAG: acyl-CoA dehydrogenase [Gemmatimonadota bacterium]